MPSPTTPAGSLGQFAFIRPVTSTGVEPDIWLASVWPASGASYATTLVRLTDDPGVETGLAWSPDGTRLAFIRRVGVTDTLWLVNADGSGQRRIAIDADAGTTPSWSPDGRRLVFQRSDEDGENIARVDVDGTGLVRLTDDGLSDAATWSPTADLVAFRRHFFHGLDGPAGTSSVWLMRSDGSDQRALTSGQETVIEPLAWSPDGSRIAFGRHGSTPETSERSSLYVIGVDGSGEIRLTDGSGADGDPVWASDGTVVMFGRMTRLASEQSTADLWIANADGSGAYRLLQTDTTEFGAAWSPEGSLIACSAESGPAGGGIAILAAVGTGMTIVDANGSLPVWRPGT